MDEFVHLEKRSCLNLTIVGLDVSNATKVVSCVDKICFTVNLKVVSAE